MKSACQVKLCKKVNRKHDPTPCRVTAQQIIVKTASHVVVSQPSTVASLRPHWPPGWNMAPKVLVRVRPLLADHGDYVGLSSSRDEDDCLTSSVSAAPTVTALAPAGGTGKAATFGVRVALQSEAIDQNVRVAGSRSVKSLNRRPRQIKGSRTKTFRGFSHVIEGALGNKAVTALASADLVAAAARGRTGSLLVYGHSGAGKTHTIFGTPGEAGVWQLTTEQLVCTLLGKGGDCVPDAAPDRLSATGSTTKTLTKQGAKVVSVATENIATAPRPVEPAGAAAPGERRMVEAWSFARDYVSQLHNAVLNQLVEQGCFSDTLGKVGAMAEMAAAARPAVSGGAPASRGQPSVTDAVLAAAVPQEQAVAAPKQTPAMPPLSSSSAPSSSSHACFSLCGADASTALLLELHMTEPTRLRILCCTLTIQSQILKRFCIRTECARNDQNRCIRQATERPCLRSLGRRCGVHSAGRARR